LSIQKITYQLFRIGRFSANYIGLAGPLRMIIGPTIGKLMFNLSSRSQSVVEVEGHRMALASKEKYPPIRMAMGEYETETTQLFRDHINPGMTILDIGAHVGYYTLLAARLAGSDGRVFSFEPDQDNYALLVHNVQLNGYDNVTTVNQAVSDKSSSRTLFISALDNGRHSMYHQRQPESGSITVSATTADDYFGEINWPEIDLIKLDVEGSELDVINGMTELLKRSPAAKIIMELNPNLLENANVASMDLLSQVIKRGFTLYRVEENTAPIELSSAEFEPLVQSLASSGGSVNLLCIRS
jgi:FkbM family methyltransferase